MVPGRTDNVCVRHYKILTKQGPSRQVNARPIRTQGGRFVQWQKVPACQATAAAPASDSLGVLEAPQEAAGTGRGSTASMGEAAASAQQPQPGETREVLARAKNHQRASKDQAAVYEEVERSDAPSKASAKDRKRRKASESHAAPPAPEAHASSAGARKHCTGLRTHTESCTGIAHLKQYSKVSAGADGRQNASVTHAAASAEAAQPDRTPEAAAGASKGRHAFTAVAADATEGAQPNGASLPSGCLGAQEAKADDRQPMASISSADCHRAAEASPGQGRRTPRPATRSQAAALDIVSAGRTDAGHAVRTRKRNRRHNSGQV